MGHGDRFLVPYLLFAKSTVWDKEPVPVSHPSSGNCDFMIARKEQVGYNVYPYETGSIVCHTEDIMDRNSFQKGIKDGIPIGLGYFAVSFTFGIMAVSGGLSVWQAVLISLTNLTSAGQFAGLGIIFAGGSYWEMALTQLIINLRYCLMSFSLAQKLRRDVSWAHRFGVAFGVTDEIFGISAAQEGKVHPSYNYGAMCVAIPGWTLGTLAGAVSGSVLPTFIMSPLSVAIYGMFLAIIIPPSKKNRSVLRVVIAAMALGTAFAYVPGLKQISSGFAIIIITVLVAGTAAWIAPVEEEKVA